MIWRQTGAILLDAYRELNAKKLFWITLILSGLVVAAFGAIGINEQGLTLLKWPIHIPGLNSTIISPEDFYKLTFVNLGIKFWLAWIAMILALVSTAGIFPDLIASGSIDLVLSKPISRTRLFITKYVSGLLFVVLQVGVFSAASFLVIGIRGGAWEFGLFLAVPLVTLVFSYLFSLCVLLGIVTRSTIASLLITILIWFMIFLVNQADGTLLLFKTRAEMQIQRSNEVITDTTSKLDELKAQLERTKHPDNAKAESVDTSALERRIASGEAYLKKVNDDLNDSESTAQSLAPWYATIFAGKTILPKTSETTELLRRWLVDIAHLQKQSVEEARGREEPDENLKSLFGDSEDVKRPKFTQVTMEEVQVEVVHKIDSRSVTWVIGTSLGFEAAMLAIAGFIFYRRDF